MIDLPGLKRALNITVDTGDTLLTEQLARAIAWVEQHFERRFQTPLARTEYQYGSGTRELLLDGHVESGAVTMTERLPGGDPVAFTAFTRRGDRLVRDDGGRWSPRNEYAITYLDGYTDPPGDITSLIIELVRLDAESSSGDTGIVSETIGDYSYRISEAVAAAGGEVAGTFRRTYNRWRRQH